MKTKALFGTAILALGVASAGVANTTTQLNTEVSQMNTLTTSQGESNVIGKISGDFNSFLGQDSTAVVTGLRNGTPITLTTTTAGPMPESPPVVSTTVITPPTGKMGFGNVYISLALAKQQLGQLGITQPTPEQLQAALTGGTITTGTGTTATSTTLQGILTMRSQNMGWGQIAQKLGFKLGPVISSMKSANKSMATTTGTSATTSKGTGASVKANAKSGSGIVSGSGKTHGNSSAGLTGKKSSGTGIVTASGRSGGGNAYGLGKGIVTGGGSAANGGAVSAGGHGNGTSSGHGKGHSK